MRTMKTLVTPLLIKYLQNTGYRYCLVRNKDTAADKPAQCQSLLPLRKKPIAGSLPDRYYTRLKMDEQAIAGIEDAESDTLVVMELDMADLAGYMDFLYQSSRPKSA